MATMTRPSGPVGILAALVCMIHYGTCTPTHHRTVHVRVAAEPNPPPWPASVAVFHPGDPTIAAKVNQAFATNGGHTPSNHGQFSSSR